MTEQGPKKIYTTGDVIQSQRDCIDSQQVCIEAQKQALLRAEETLKLLQSDRNAWRSLAHRFMGVSFLTSAALVALALLHAFQP
jgi:hypothetical protein